MTRIYLSPPDVGVEEGRLVQDAIRSNWVAPVGPQLEAFERELATQSQRRFGVGLSSGTAALHLALKEHGVGVGDEVLVSTFTFAAPANAVAYLGACPLFVDCEPESWNVSVMLVAEELQARAASGRLPAAAVVVDVYGQCADYARLLPLFAEYGIPVVEDAAEALGAKCDGEPAGSFGRTAVVSFNGNKIITTSGGGMLLCDDERFAERVRYLATQARQDAPYYEHTEIGFNYRLSNMLAAFGRGQLADLDRRVERRRAINARYRDALDCVPGIAFMPEATYAKSTFWLTCITVDPAKAACTREDLRVHLESHDVESRPTWKPMHLQPVFAEAPRRVDGTSGRLFEHGLCLPSGSSLTDAEQDRIVSLLWDRLGV